MEGIEPWCNGPLGHWGIEGAFGAFAHWRIGVLAHWRIGGIWGICAFAHWRIEGIGPLGGISGHWGNGAFEHWRIGALAHWRIGAWLRAHPYPNQVAEQLVSLGTYISPYLPISPYISPKSPLHLQVAEQLVSLGTLEAVELMGLGYPVRIPYDDVRRRYASRLSAS